jgi:hypothetical protein
MAAKEINSSNLEDFQYLIDLINEGRNDGENKVTPIISNSFRMEEIFREDDELMGWLQKDQVPTFYDEVHTLDHQLAKKWANKFEYPMSDGHRWARVAQYLQVDPKKTPGTEYLRFLKGELLALGRNKKGYEEKVTQLEPWIDWLNLSDIATDLDYPTFPAGREDPLLLLAKLPFPVYITTSYSDFLERALLKVGKVPRRQICFYTGKTIKDISKDLPDSNFNPDPMNPAVYYLFGMEEYRPTLVLSEDDYLDFLMRADGVIGAQNFPSPLSLAFSNSSLLLLGYSLRDWDFRTLFRLILKFRQETRKKPGIAIQFKPSLGQKNYQARAESYLKQYFENQKFEIRWTNTEKFIYDLWSAYVRSSAVQV